MENTTLSDFRDEVNQESTESIMYLGSSNAAHIPLTRYMKRSRISAMDSWTVAVRPGQDGEQDH